MDVLGLDLSEEGIYLYGLIYRNFRDCLGNMCILEEMLGTEFANKLLSSISTYL